MTIKTCKRSDMIKITQYILYMLRFSLLFSYARSKCLIHKISELKAIPLENPKILIQNFQVNKKLIKM